MNRRLGVSAALVDGALLPGDVGVTDGVVTEVGLPAARGGRIAAPGLIDLQVNGFAGIDLMGADADGVREVGRALAGYGVTAWLPTLITATPADTAAALKVLATVVPTTPGRWDDGSAEPLGVHVEGPYLSPHRLGTHPPQHRRDPDPAEMAGWRSRGPIVAVTLAPELPGALAMVAALAADGVLVSLGHTDATAKQAHAGFDAGARTVTHLFNAMSGLHHRAPGVPGAALARPDVVVQLIVDGHHLAPDVVRTAWSAATGRVVLVTDATSAAAHPEGEAEGDYDLAGVAVQVRDGAVRNDDGTLAGSALTLDRAVRNACELGIDPAAALTAATRTPADLLGRRDLGRLEPGSRADLVVLDDALAVCDTLLAGCPGGPVTTALARETAEQPQVLAGLLDRTLPRLDELRAGLLGDHPDDVRGVVVAARGSSDNAARYAQYLWALRLGLPVALAIPSLQTVYGATPDLSGQLVVGISQSGSSPDVVGVVAAARAQGRPTVAVTNDPDSDLGRAAGLVLDLAAGEERSVAATKTYTASLLAVALIGAALDGDPRRRAQAVEQLRLVPQAAADVLDQLTGSDAVDEAAAVLAPYDRGVAVGRGLNLSTAYEVALKTTELAGLLVSPYSPADLRHGPLGAVGPGTPALLVLPDEPASATVADVAGALAERGAPVVAIAARSGPGAAALEVADAVLPLPPGIADWLSPLVAVLPGQLAAARLAETRGVDVDRPGGLTKVTRTS